MSVRQPAYPSRLQNSSKAPLSSPGWGLNGSNGASVLLGMNSRPALSGFAQVMGGGSGNTGIDMSDFPSLSGGPQPAASTTQSTWNGGILRSQSQQRIAQTQPVSSTLLSSEVQNQPEDTGQSEDYPPLHNDGLRSPEQTTLAFRDATARTSKAYADMSEKEKYGLEGLAAAYDARKASELGQPVDETLPPIMRSGLFYGQDLNALGMDLDSPDPIWPTFTAFPASTSQAQGAGAANGIFDFHDRAIVPEFTLPHAYTVTNVPPLSSRLGSLSDETLFCIFYQNPRDLLQEQAAQELTARAWRWHTILRQWIQKDSPLTAATSSSGPNNTSLPVIDLTNNQPVTLQNQRVGLNAEKGIFIFFDVMNWRRERREFVLAYDELDQRFASDISLSGAAPGLGAVGREGSVVGAA